MNNSSRVLIVANALIPTVQLGYLIPLEQTDSSSSPTVGVLIEADITRGLATLKRGQTVIGALGQMISDFGPSVIIFCRYSGQYANLILDYAIKSDVATIFAIDDDLLGVPRELGEKKYNFHNDPKRISALTTLLNCVDLVHCSNSRLLEVLRARGIRNSFRVSEVFCAQPIRQRAVQSKVRVIGYMGFDHETDFQIVKNALIRTLERFPNLRFELFGKIPLPVEFRKFGTRISVIPPEYDYKTFVAKLTALNWDIGIAPLTKSEFNRVKNVNKWIEYTAVGAAVIASRGTIYDDCCSNGRGLLVDDDEWERAFELLISNPTLRYQTVTSAQTEIESNYRPDRQSAELLSIIDEAVRIAKTKHRRVTVYPNAHNQESN